LILLRVGQAPLNVRVSVLLSFKQLDGSFTELGILLFLDLLRLELLLVDCMDLDVLAFYLLETLLKILLVLPVFVELGETVAHIVNEQLRKLSVAF
jgi:hypothetical protein